MRRRILLTGANGFLGKLVVKKLIQNNYEVIGLSRSDIGLSRRHKTAPLAAGRMQERVRDSDAEGTPGFNPGGAPFSSKLKWLKLDLFNTAIVKKFSPLFSEIEYVIHMAAQIPQRDDKRIWSFFNNNLIATINLMKALPLNIKQFIYCSSIDVYGNPNTIPVNEYHLTQPITYYGVTKLFGEHLANIYFKQRQTAVTILRFTQLYGPGEPKIKIIPTLIEHILTGKEISIENAGRDIRDYLFIEDAASSIIESLDKPLHGVFNVSSGKGVTIRYVIETLENIARKKVKVNYLPIKKISSYILDNQKFCTITNWKPRVSLFEGLKKQYEFELQLKKKN